MMNWPMSCFIKVKQKQAFLHALHVVFVVVPVTHLLQDQPFCCMVLNSAATCFISMSCPKKYHIHKSPFTQVCM